MLLTSDQENDYIEKNMKKIYNAVDNYVYRCSSNVIGVPYEEMVQEACIALLKYLRRCETDEEAEKFPFYSVKSALRDLVFTYQPLSVPHSTHRFSEICSGMPPTVSFDTLPSSVIEVDGMSHHWVEDKDTEIDFDMFMADKSDADRRLIGMKFWGGTLRNVAEQFGTSKDSVKRSLDRLHAMYSDFIKESDEDE